MNDTTPSAVQAANVPEVTWVLYRAENGDSILSSAGLEGREDAARNPVALAVAKLIENTAEHPSWCVKVFGPDDRLLAWAEWDGMRPVGYLARQTAPKPVRHALSPLYGRVTCVDASGPRCGATDGRTVVMAADVDCPDCRALMDKEGARQ